MKKLLVMIAIFIIPFIVYAKEVKVNDINMKFNVKDDYIVILRDNLDNNSDLKKLGITKDYMKSTLETSNIYADIISKDISYEIIVVVPDVTISFKNLSDATDPMLEDLKNELAKRTGAEVSSVYKGNHNFVVVDYYDEKTEYYIVNYYTVENFKGYNIQLQKKSTITDEEKKDLKELVDSVNIDEIKEENTNNKNNNTSFRNIVLGALIGAGVGLISYLVGMFIRKKKSSK